jgi:hypothetical protein
VGKPRNDIERQNENIAIMKVLLGATKWKEYSKSGIW